MKKIETKKKPPFPFVTEIFSKKKNELMNKEAKQLRNITIFKSGGQVLVLYPKQRIPVYHGKDKSFRTIDKHFARVSISLARVLANSNQAEIVTGWEHLEELSN